jgi:hypothetical protein
MGILDERLPEWLHGISLDPSGSDLAAHRQVVDSLVGVADKTNVLLLVGFAHGLLGGDKAAAFSVVEAAAQAVDETWTAEADSLLAVRLTGAAVAHILSQRTQLAIATALSTSAATFVGGTPTVPELTELAESRLGSLATLVRSSGLPALPAFRQHVDSQIKTQLPQQVPEGQPLVQVTSNELRAYLTEMRGASRSLADDADATIGELVRHVRRLSEEVDLLWWALEPHSDLLVKGWGDSGIASVVPTALELARRLSFDPPALGARGIAWHALLAAGVEPGAPAKFGEVVAQSPPDPFTAVGPTYTAFGWSQPALQGLRAATGDGGSDTSREASETEVEGYEGLVASKVDWVLRFVRDISLGRVLRP